MKKMNATAVAPVQQRRRGRPTLGGSPLGGTIGFRLDDAAHVALNRKKRRDETRHQAARRILLQALGLA